MLPIHLIQGVKYTAERTMTLASGQESGLTIDKGDAPKQAASEAALATQHSSQQGE